MFPLLGQAYELKRKFFDIYEAKPITMPMDSIKTGFQIYLKKKYKVYIFLLYTKDIQLSIVLIVAPMSTVYNNLYKLVLPQDQPKGCFIKWHDRKFVILILL